MDKLVKELQAAEIRNCHDFAETIWRILRELDEDGVRFYEKTLFPFLVKIAGNEDLAYAWRNIKRPGWRSGDTREVARLLNLDASQLYRSISKISRDIDTLLES